MRVLLDTNVLLWAMTNDSRIESVRELLLDADTDVYASAVSWWEIAIKSRIGKLSADVVYLRAVSKISGFLELPLLGPCRGTDKTRTIS